METNALPTHPPAPCDHDVFSHRFIRLLMATSFDDFNGKEMSSAIFCQPPALALCFVFLLLRFWRFEVQQLTSRDQCLGLQNLNIQPHDSFLMGDKCQCQVEWPSRCFSFRLTLRVFLFFQAGISSLTSCAGETNDYTGCSFQVNKSPPWHLIWFHSSSRFNGKTDPHFHPINFFFLQS